MASLLLYHYRTLVLSDAIVAQANKAVVATVTIAIIGSVLLFFIMIR
jgi:hypothetical protein